MKTFIVEYRIDGGRWQAFDRHMRARSAAGAIGTAAKYLKDILGTLEISAVER